MGATIKVNYLPIADIKDRIVIEVMQEFSNAESQLVKMVVTVESIHWADEHEGADGICIDTRDIDKTIKAQWMYQTSWSGVKFLPEERIIANMTTKKTYNPNYQWRRK